MRIITGMPEIGEGASLSSITVVGDSVRVPDLEAEGPVRYLTLSGERDDATWGVLGMVWLSADVGRGGFLASPSSPWRGSEMARSYESARRRGFTPGEIYAYWRDAADGDGYHVDPERGAESLRLLSQLVTVL
ncbi:MAG TPA: hypothetical protein VE669_00145 [Actinomycetota bacterium]|nr:hypothetical protein [Actinomycetota bacterium]